MSRSLVYTATLIAVVCLFGCSKKISSGTKGLTNPDIAAASQYFNENLSSIPVGAKATKNIRLSTPRNLLWDSAYTVRQANINFVVVPVKFSKALYMQTAFSGKLLFNLNDINKVAFYKDSAGQYHCQSVTLFPDSNYLQGNAQQFTGIALNESWDGALSERYRYNADGSVLKANNPTPAAVTDYSISSLHSGKETDMIISECSDIS